MNDQTHRYKLKILEHHLDSYGHVNNATYIEIFEEARWDLITNNGYGFQRVHETQIGPVVLGIEIKFLKELKLRENIVIETNVIEYSGKVGKLSQKIFREKETAEACSAIFTFGLFDMKIRKLILPTPEWKRAIGT